jgi:tetraprenyl-beta-curcumene synthase
VAGPWRRRPLLANAFATAAFNYWLGVYPNVTREIAHWRGRARAIPDSRLAKLALLTQSNERGNLEGAAVFAVLAGSAYRHSVVTATVAFQALYDFVDTLAERPAADPVANGERLHQALLAALDATRPHLDYLEHSGMSDDGGYLVAMIETCRGSLAELPGYPAAQGPALRATERMIVYQSLNHDPADESHALLSQWANRLTPAAEDMRWWEAAAGAASSLGVFALIAAAASPGLTPAEADALELAYFPWIGSLHVLLDSLIDRVSDLRTGDHSLVESYEDSEDMAERLGSIAQRALLAADGLPRGSLHTLILAAMSSFYLSRPVARGAVNGPATQRVLAELGPSARPAMAVLLTRRRLARALAWLRQARRLSRPGPIDLIPTLETQVVDFPLVPIGSAEE